MDGRQRKFVLKGDLDMPGLEAGRFWFARTRQIIVIGLPNDKARHQLQYVIVMSPRRSSWHRLSNGWTAVNYKVWKPSEQDGKYYEGVPDVVWKAQGPAQDTGVEKAMNDPAAALHGSVSSLSGSSHGEHLSSKTAAKQQLSLHDMPFVQAKRKHSIQADSDSFPAFKKHSTETEEDTETTPSNTSLNSGDSNDRASIDDSPTVDSVLAHKSRLGTLSLGREDTTKASIHPTDTRAQIVSNKRLSTEKGAKNTLSMLQSDGTMHMSSISEGTSAISINVKREKSSGDSTNTAAITIDCSGNRLPAGTHSKPQDSDLERHVPKSPPSASAVPSPNSTVGVIDLTNEHEYNALPTIPCCDVNAIFVDEHDQVQHKIPFDECKTARLLFEEACAQDVANKETRMLEVEISGCSPVRVRRDCENHFEQKILQPLKQIMEDNSKAGEINMRVRKYM